MALIECKECGRKVSDKADACPNCACPLKVEIYTEKKFKNLPPVERKKILNYYVNNGINDFFTQALQVLLQLFFLIGIIEFIVLIFVGMDAIIVSILVTSILLFLMIILTPLAVKEQQKLYEIHFYNKEKLK